MYQHRLIPGIAVEVQPPVVPEGLPRMDVALFVGFAQRGPVHRPVRVDSVDAYRATFGGDLVLAAGHANGPEANATLPSCVRAFFSNGGTRAWVIRVARTAEMERRCGRSIAQDTASTRTFALKVNKGDGAPPLVVRAASLGSWADNMHVSARLDRTGSSPRLMLRADVAGEADVRGPFSIDPADTSGWWAQTDDDAFYADRNTVAQPRNWLAPAGAPILHTLDALTDSWSEPVGAEPDPRTPLERDGLSRFDASLFLDPTLADSTVMRLADDAGQMRDIDGVQLLGLHGAFAVPGGNDFGEPSLIAIPDAAQLGWTGRVPPKFIKPKNTPGEIPEAWRDHRGSCAIPAARKDAEGPDRTRFLDCATSLLAMPVFDALVELQTGIAVDLRWSQSEPGATYVLEEAGRADFKDAFEIWRGPDLSKLVQTKREGTYYYRVHAEHDGNISMPSVTGFLLQRAAWETLAPCNYVTDTLVTLHAALLRACASMGDQFALLSLPRHFWSHHAAQHVDAVRSAFAGAERPLSFGALYHPWIVAAKGSATDPTTQPTPPEGAVAGTFARRARDRGAWIAPARVPLQDIVALSPALPDTQREAFAAAGINLVRNDAIGFVASDTFTLSREFDWRQVNVRRLISLLRRAATRWGAPFVFEPYGDTLRRAIERIFGHALDDMVRRGAFAGKGGNDSYRLAVDASGSDRNNGKLVVEIGVAPSQPMRFLTLVLAQAGERFTVAEER